MGTVAATFWDTGQVREREQLVPAKAWFTTLVEVSIARPPAATAHAARWPRCPTQATS